jgi:hypothetical protein
MAGVVIDVVMKSKRKRKYRNKQNRTWEAALPDLSLGDGHFLQQTDG